ncbi:MAG: excinuclease ABC subunit UvrC [Acidimicrobiaceae bacterium]
MKHRPSVVIPESPGSYQFKDGAGRVIYVGKANNLRARINSYFAKADSLHPRTNNMVEVAQSVEWIEVRNEVEALILEHSLINRFSPRFNIRLRDDKSYPFLAVTIDEQWPRAMVMRGRKRKGTKYFGPYPHAWAIHETLDLLLKTFPIRTCSQATFKQHERLGRPCLLFHIEKCSGPCVGSVTADTYSHLVTDFLQVMDGESDSVVSRLEEQMGESSRAQDFERAAKYRDQLEAIKLALERQQMVGERDEDLDIIGIAEDEFEAAVQIFYVRKGRVVGRKGFIVDKVEDVTSSGLAALIVERLYDDAPILGLPKIVVLPIEPDRKELLQQWLTQTKSTKVEIRVPQRGDKRELHELVTLNAKQELNRHRLRRAADHTARSRALSELQDLLGLPEAPLRIECYDMAHLQGTDYVGSMVVLEDGLPLKRDYRKFKIKSGQGNDDYAAMREVLTRRLTAYIKERDQPISERGERPGKFSYAPQLLLVDGGKGQLSVAEQVVRELGLEHEIPVASLAKKLEEVFIPGRSEPVEVPRGSDALFMLQVIRDEAHRFANRFHRELRGKRMTKSELDGISGLGPTRIKKLVAALGGVKEVKKASREQLYELKWLPKSTADAVYEQFHSTSTNET